jgi:hypothetical protein
VRSAFRVDGAVRAVSGTGAEAVGVGDGAADSLGVGLGPVLTVPLGVADGVAKGVGVGVGVRVGVGVEVAVGDVVGAGVPCNCTLTVAASGPMAVVVIVTPLAGSVNPRPSPSGASVNDAVDGVVSSSRDCRRLGMSFAIRIVTPFTTGAVDGKLS